MRTINFLGPQSSTNRARGDLFRARFFGSAQAHHVQCIDTMAGSSASNILLPVQDRAINAMQQG